jgi:UDP-glucose 4-epimerase
MTTVLVTGASGFIGRTLVTALARAGHRVVAASRQPAAFANGAVRTVRLPDLSGHVDWAALIGDATHVVHLAAVAHKGAAVPASTYELVNRRAVAELAAAAKQKGIERLIFLSSIGSQSGPASDRVLTEDDEPRPTSTYGRTKLGAEADLRASGVAHTILRPVLTYGPDAPGNIANLMKLAASPLWLPFGAVSEQRSLVAIDNLIGAIAFAIAEPRTAGEIYIVADADVLTLPEIITVLRAAIGRPPGLVAVPPAVLAAALRLVGAAEMWERLGGSLVASPQKLIAAGWRPVLGTRAGLAAMARSWIAGQARIPAAAGNGPT